LPDDLRFADDVSLAVLRNLLVVPRRARLKLAVARVIASDPGGLALRRALRGTLSFLLTLLLIWGTGSVIGKPVMAMALGFPVSIFACVVVREHAAGRRLLATLGLAVGAAVSFSASALITNAWINHGVFVALVFVVVLMRGRGSVWAAAGFGAFVSFFFGAFLAPPPAALAWHLLGLLIATGAALLIQFAVIPHSAGAALDRAMAAIRQRLALLLVPIEQFCAPGHWRDSDKQRLRAQVDLLKTSIATARTQLDATDGGWRGRSGLSFHLFEVEAAAERLARLALQEGEATVTAQTGARASALRDWLVAGAHRPLDLPEAPGLIGEALEELRDAMQRLRNARANDTEKQAPVRQDDVKGREPDKQHGLSPALRLAIQTSSACALAVVGGEWLSPQRWYWAVITVFVMFSNTSSRGDALFKSLQRVAGTVAGVVAGIALVWLVGGAQTLEFALLPTAIFLTFYFFTDRYGVMVFFLTVMLALLYALLDRFSPGVLWLRLEETAVGAVSGVLVSAVLLPRQTRDQVRERFDDLVQATRTFCDAAVERLAEGHGHALGAHTRDFEDAYAAMRDAIGPLRLDRLGGGAELYGTLSDGLRSCSYWVHELALAGRGSGGPASDADKRSLLWHRDRFGRRLNRLRRRLDAGETRAVPDHGGGHAEGRPPRSPDDRLNIATRALRNISTALNHLGNAIVSGEHDVTFFRY